jgi:hypothetical protein
MMSDRLFDSPVYVRDGTRLVRQIQSIGDALDFLDEWHADRRGMTFEVAQQALDSAHDGRLPMTAAQNAFCSWASASRDVDRCGFGHVDHHSQPFVFPRNFGGATWSTLSTRLRPVPSV